MGSTRGFFLGQIIDELGGIAHQVETRCQLGHTDLNRMLEDFFKDVINILLDLSLENLNTKRSNEPGLDLGDTFAKVALQVTSRATYQKVNKTLHKITVEQIAAFDKFRILVIGDKQGSYTIDSAAAKKLNFSTEDIWDINDLCRFAVALPMVRLQRLHQLVMAEVVRVRVDLEVPGPDGKYPTSMDDFIEPIGAVKRSDGSVFAEAEGTETLYDTTEQAAAALDAFADALAELPRLSREFYAWMLSRREAHSGIGSGGYRVNADLVSRASRYPDTIGELRFLADRGFICYDRPEDDHQSPYWSILFPGTDQHFDDALLDFLDQRGIELKRVIVSLDFSVFGNPVNEASSA